MAIKYKPGGNNVVTIGKSQDVTLPARVFRGRATCMHFDTDKSFLLPPSLTGVRNIVTFFNRHSDKKMLVNGHTDLVGDAQYNLQLSNERAAAVTAYLVDDVDTWLAWYSAAIPSKRWSTLEDQYMLQNVNDGSGKPYYSGLATGYANPDTQDAIKRFQGDNGLNADGVAGDDTRRALIGKYMALEGTSLPAGTTIAQHGCGLFHPIDATSGADQGNRRVEIFLFEGAIDPPPQSTCPSPGCAEYPQWVGNPDEDIDLCQPLASSKHRLLITLLDVKEQPRVGVAYKLVVGADSISDVTNASGQIDQMVDDSATTGTLSVDDQDLSLQINALQPVDTIAGAQGRLSNLGYSPGDVTGSMNQQTQDALKAFQSSHDVPVTGQNDAATQAKLQSVYGS